MKAHLIALACLWVTGCNSSTEPSSSFPTSPLIQRAISDSGQFEVALFTAPEQPPTFGTVSIQLRISDAASGAPSDGLRVGTAPVMPSMGHGTSAVPDAEVEGEGLYVFPAVNLFMSGRWDLVTEIAGPTSDTITLSIDVR